MSDDSIRRGLAQTAAGQTTERPDLLTGERLVIVIEYDMVTDPQHALNDAMTQIREGSDRLDPEVIKVVGVHVGIKDYADRVLAMFDKAAP
jgi:formyltetrahydrofolate hydrolase